MKKQSIEQMVESLEKVNAGMRQVAVELFPEMCERPSTVTAKEVQ
jgi:hypothetical protein